jgi:hypothetical protein
MAEDKKGILNLSLLPKSILKFVSDGKTDEYRGTNSTSSNVNASLISSIYTYKQL